MRLVRTLRLAGLPAVAPVAGAQADQPVTGHPDIQGLWTTTYITPLERPPEAPSLVLTPNQPDALLDVLWRQRDARDPLGPLARPPVGELPPFTKDQEHRAVQAHIGP